MRETATTGAMNVSALSRNTGPVPTQPMSTPARPGPMSRALLKEALLSPTALGRSSRGTSSETNVCRAGPSIAVAVPSSAAKT
jgi:hypothetical protein